MGEKSACVLIVAGGTGGHIFPGLAVAERLQCMGANVQWIGGERGLEQRLVPRCYPLHSLKMGAFRGKGFSHKISGLVQLARAFFSCRRKMKALSPVAVLVMGGYVSAPAGLAAKSLSIRLLVHEQNAIPGLANRLLAKCADGVFEAFPQTYPQKVAATVTGNPVRSAFYQIKSPAERFAVKRLSFRVLVIGGSQGAGAINQAVILAAKEMQGDDVVWWHQTGESTHDTVLAAYQDTSVACRCDAFIENMAEAFAWADVVISRAGALSVSEIAAVGLASVLIPYPHAVDDHQYYNAKQLEILGAAWILRQKDLTSAVLVEKLRHWSQHRDELLLMAEKAQELAKPDAADVVAAGCLATDIADTTCHLEREYR